MQNIEEPKFLFFLINEGVQHFSGYIDLIKKKELFWRRLRTSSQRIWKLCPILYVWYACFLFYVVLYPKFNLIFNAFHLSSLSYSSKLSFLSFYSHILSFLSPLITINVPLFKKLRDIIFFCGTITLWAISRDILRGPRLFWPLKLSRAQRGTI